MHARCGAVLLLRHRPPRFLHVRESWEILGLTPFPNIKLEPEKESGLFQATSPENAELQLGLGLLRARSMSFSTSPSTPAALPIGHGSPERRSAFALSADPQQG